MRAVSPRVLESWRLAAVGAVGDPAARPIFAMLIAGATLASGWAIASLPPKLALSVMGAVVGLTLWLQAPVLAVYGLAAIIPFSLDLTLGGINGASLRDPILMALGVSVATAVAARQPRIDRLKTGFARRIMWIWVPLGIWFTISFLLGPANAGILSGPFQNAWYIYGDLWRQLLVFPLVVVCLGDRRSVEIVLNLIVLVGAGVAINAILLAAGSDENATGHFDHNNPLAGYLVMVLPWAAARAALHHDKTTRIVSAVAMVPMLRALWLAGSRGGLVAFLVSMAVLVLFFSMRRVAALGVAGLVGLSVLLGARGFDIPMLKRFMVLRDYKEVETYQWRQEQWQIFIDRIKERPLLGWGSDVDEGLVALERARTAHNAFLAYAVKAGLPGSIAWVVILSLSVALALRRVLSTRGLDLRWFWAGMLSFLAAIVMHNMVESMLLTAVSQGLFWTILACAAVLARVQEPMPGAGALAAPPRPA